MFVHIGLKDSIIVVGSISLWSLFILILSWVQLSMTNCIAFKLLLSLVVIGSNVVLILSTFIVAAIPLLLITKGMFQRCVYEMVEKLQ